MVLLACSYPRTGTPKYLDFDFQSCNSKNTDFNRKKTFTVGATVAFVSLLVFVFRIKVQDQSSEKCRGCQSLRGGIMFNLLIDLSQRRRRRSKKLGGDFYLAEILTR